MGHSQFKRHHQHTENRKKKKKLEVTIAITCIEFRKKNEKIYIYEVIKEIHTEMEGRSFRISNTE